MHVDGPTRDAIIEWLFRHAESMYDSETSYQMAVKDAAAHALYAFPVSAEPSPNPLREAREIGRRECLTCGTEIQSYLAPKSGGTVPVIGCPKGHGFVVDREGRRRSWDEVSKVVVYRETLATDQSRKEASA